MTTADTPSQAVAMGLCPMCLGHGTTHKLVPVEGLSECSGCAGGKTMDAFWAEQDRLSGVPLDRHLALTGGTFDSVALKHDGTVEVVHSDDDGTDVELQRPTSSPFKHDGVFARFPKGTDPLAAIRETMGVFMERTDGTNALPWWSAVRWWHGGPAGFRRGDILRPPSQTGVIPGMAGTDPDSVYLTTDRNEALMFSARHHAPRLYEVARLAGEPIHDDVLPDSTTCWRVPSAMVYRVEVPSALELRRVLYELES